MGVMMSRWLQQNLTWLLWTTMDPFWGSSCWGFCGHYPGFLPSGGPVVALPLSWSCEWGCPSAADPFPLLSAGAQCLDLMNQVTCRCPLGFTGSRCETNIDDCASRPCFNAGTCVDGVNNFTCRCPLGFTSNDCSEHRNPCDQFPCHNGGACYVHFTGPVCKCSVGFMGNHCEYFYPPEKEGVSPALVAAITLGLITLSMLVCAAVHILRQLRRSRELAAISTSVKNDLEAINNRNAVIGGGIPNNGSSLKEKESFLLPGGHLKVSNKDAALAEKGGDISVFKRNLAGCNLAKEEQRLETSKFDL